MVKVWYGTVSVQEINVSQCSRLCVCAFCGFPQLECWIEKISRRTGQVSEMFICRFGRISFPGSSCFSLFLSCFVCGCEQRRNNKNRWKRSLVEFLARFQHILFSSLKCAVPSSLGCSVWVAGGVLLLEKLQVFATVALLGFAPFLLSMTQEKYNQAYTWLDQPALSYLYIWM